LEGLRVLDLGAFVAGPFGATLLADFGAEVIKVETPTGDPYRLYSCAFLVFNRHKWVVTLDLKHPDGREALYALAATADVVTDNLRPGVRERLGIDYASLAAVNPRLVRSTVTAWGDHNPQRARQCPRRR
jgi:crotonobetainyl-CoA:carnitine CoA-transferase CaiB-like acyl-CoA transferase